MADNKNFAQLPEFQPVPYEGIDDSIQPAGPNFITPEQAIAEGRLQPYVPPVTEAMPAVPAPEHVSAANLQHSVGTEHTKPDRLNQLGKAAELAQTIGYAALLTAANTFIISGAYSSAQLAKSLHELQNGGSIPAYYAGVAEAKKTAEITDASVPLVAGSLGLWGSGRLAEAGIAAVRRRKDKPAGAPQYRWERLY